MIFFLTSQSLWVSGAILVGLGTMVGAFGPSIVRRYVTLEKLTANNEIAGFKFATVGVLYAVLIAFVVIVVWQKYSDAEATVAREAGAAATIYRLSQGIGEKPGATLRGTLTAYLTLTIADDWPAMERGMTGASRSARQALDAIYTALLAFESTERGDVALVSEILRQLDIITQARRERLISAQGAVPGIIWLVLFGGAFVTITFTFFFGTLNLRAQTMMTALLSMLIFSELLIIVAIDRPFTGTVKVEPNALANVLADFGSEPGSDRLPTRQQQR
jgi:hypothetical protein